MCIRDSKHALPLRLQAYERLALFTERISPGALVLRLHKSSMSSGSLHSALISTIREEFGHNVTQQIYVSDKAWSKVMKAKEETIRLINLSYEQTGNVNSGTELSRKIFENTAKLSHTPSQEAMQAIKEEAVSYTHLRAHETVLDLVCRLLLEKKKKTKQKTKKKNTKQKKKKRTDHICMMQKKQRICKRDNTRSIV